MLLSQYWTDIDAVSAVDDVVFNIPDEIPISTVEYVAVSPIWLEEEGVDVDTLIFSSSPQSG